MSTLSFLAFRKPSLNQDNPARQAHDQRAEQPGQVKLALPRPHLLHRRIELRPSKIEKKAQARGNKQDARTYREKTKCPALHDSTHRPPSATAAGEPSSAEARKQPNFHGHRERKGRRLLAEGSGLEIILVLRSIHDICLVRLFAVQLLYTDYLVNMRLRVLRDVRLCRHDECLAVIQTRMHGVNETLVAALDRVI